MRRYQKILVGVCCILSSCSFIYAKDEEDGIVITIQDDEKRTVKGETMHILDDQGNVVGTFVSNADGIVELPFLSIGEYHIKLDDKNGFTQKESVPLSVTAYNQKGAMEMSIVMERKSITQTMMNPSVLLLFFFLLAGCVYLLIHGLRKESFQMRLADDL